MSDCFHCGEPVPEGITFSVYIDGADRLVCCPGCQAVAQTIMDYGLEKFYRYRTAPSMKPEQIDNEEERKFQTYNDPQFQSSFVEQHEGQKVATLLLEGVVCPACTWLIESRLSRMSGVAGISVNYSSARAQVNWDPDLIQLSDILKTLQALGYRAWPFDPDRNQTILDDERKSQLRQIGLAGLLGMQVMMISIALYFGDWSGMEQNYRAFFHWLCLLLTLPVILYSARVFYIRAWRDVRILRTGMDVPVALGLSIAFVGSVWNTVNGQGHVYYDSVVMFVFLLLVARYMEFMARQRALRHYDLLRRVIPTTVTRLDNREGIDHEELVPVVDLHPGDRLLIRPGQTIAVDGKIAAGMSSVDESIITGESTPRFRTMGDPVIGGSTNIESPVQVIVDRVGKDTTLSRVLRLVEKARFEKPHVTELTEKIASWFVFTVILLACAVAVYWWLADRSVWLPVTVAVLVVTCPCALSLATPVALTSANTALMSKGLAVAGNNVLEIMSRADRYVFDKTGTLTEGTPELSGVYCMSDRTRGQCLDLAAMLEKNSEHPFASAIITARGDVPLRGADEIMNYPGQGICGRIDDEKYFLGTVEFIQKHTGHHLMKVPDLSAPASRVILADTKEILCVFEFTDSIRSGADNLIATIKKLGKRTMLLSGDSEDAVKHVSNLLGIDEYHSRLSPEEKQELINDLIKQGEIVVYTGDGVNDAPVLASAHSSVAMGIGVDIAKLNADMILLNDTLDILARAIVHARKTTVVIKQNLAWAILYNFLALPAAAAGLIAPWMAAVGMSLSSIAVVVNSGRLGRI